MRPAALGNHLINMRKQYPAAQSRESSNDDIGIFVQYHACIRISILKIKRSSKAGEMFETPGGKRPRARPDRTKSTCSSSQMCLWPEFCPVGPRGDGN